MEAYAGTAGQDHTPVWITLDPTPVAERKRSIAQVGGIAGKFRPFTDSFRYVWIFYVIGYDGDRQERLIYGPMRTIAKELKERYKVMVAQLKLWFTRFFHFSDIGSFISIRGFFVVFIVGILSVGVAKLLFPLIRPLLRRWRGPILNAASLSAGTLFYRRFVRILAEIDLERTPTETHGEFAIRASKLLSAGGHQTDAIANVPQEIVDAFYRIRFGHRELESESLEGINRQLDALELRLNQRGA